MMSNALCLLLAEVAPASGPAATAPAPSGQAIPMIHPLILNILAVGTCALAVWIFRRIATPAKLTLRRTPGRPNSLGPEHIMLILAVYLSPIILLGVLVKEPTYHLTLPVTMAAQVICLAVSLVVAGRTFRHGLSRGMGLSMRHWIYDTARGVVSYLTIVPICLALFWLVNWLAPRQPEDMHELLRLLGEASLGWRLIVILSTVILAPLAEEVFFRGLLQSMFRKYFGQPWLAIAAASACFAMAHISQPKDIPSLLALGAALGYSYERCGRLWPAILAHALFNAVNIAVCLTPMS